MTKSSGLGRIIGRFDLFDMSKQGWVSFMFSIAWAQDWANFFGIFRPNFEPLSKNYHTHWQQSNRVKNI